MRLQDNNDQDVGKETVEVKEKEGHQETVDTPLTSPSDELPIQVFFFYKHICCPILFSNFKIKSLYLQQMNGYCKIDIELTVLNLYKPSSSNVMYERVS